MTGWLKAGNNAVITGGASGIGLAAATHYLSAGMNVLIADLDEDALSSLRRKTRRSTASVPGPMVMATTTWWM